MLFDCDWMSLVNPCVLLLLCMLKSPTRIACVPAGMAFMLSRRPVVWTTRAALSAVVWPDWRCTT